MKLSKVLAHFLQTKSIIFLGSVINLLWHLMWVRRVALETQARMASSHWPYSAHWNPVAVMFEPSLLLAGGIGLLVNRWWSVWLALLASGRVMYSLGYLPLRAIHFAHDIPILSWHAWEQVWHSVYSAQPQYLFEVGLGVVIFIHAAWGLMRSVYSRSTRPAHGG
jgi:hypothetical protein